MLCLKMLSVRFSSFYSFYFWEKCYDGMMKLSVVLTKQLPSFRDSHKTVQILFSSLLFCRCFELESENREFVKTRTGTSFVASKERSSFNISLNLNFLKFFKNKRKINGFFFKPISQKNKDQMSYNFWSISFLFGLRF